jgi:hypothetical protein
MAFRCSTLLEAFLAELDAGDGDDEARTNAQHRLHTELFTVTTGDNDDGFTGTVPSLHGQLLVHSCAGSVGFLLQGVCATRRS